MASSGEKIKIVVFCGPTAVGKTSVAIRTAQVFGGEIINADSMQIYRYMDIGTAKPSPAERDLIFHHLIDIVDPDGPFDAAKFSHEAGKVISALDRQGKPAFIVGGTGLYIKALVHGLFEAAPSDPNIRKRLRSDLAIHGSKVLYDRLVSVDPETAEKIHPNDAHRIIRAIEVFESSGRPISDFQNAHGFTGNSYHTLKIGLAMGREKLYRRINTRVDAMIEAGFVDEVRHLINRGYSSRLKSMQALGYRHMADYLEGRLLFEEAVRTMKRDTRRYAKRQFTWFTRDPDIVWMQPAETEEIIQCVGRFLNH